MPTVLGHKQFEIEPTLARNLHWLRLPQIYILVDVIFIAFMRMTINFAMFILSDALWIL